MAGRQAPVRATGGLAGSQGERPARRAAASRENVAPNVASCCTTWLASGLQRRAGDMGPM